MIIVVNQYRNHYVNFLIIPPNFIHIFLVLLCLPRLALWMLDDLPIKSYGLWKHRRPFHYPSNKLPEYQIYLQSKKVIKMWNRILDWLKANMRPSKLVLGCSNNIYAQILQDSNNLWSSKIVVSTTLINLMPVTFLWFFLFLFLFYKSSNLFLL